MKDLIKLLGLIALFALAIRAQNAAQPSLSGVDPTTTVASCTIPATPVGWTWFCYTGDGKIYVSIKGAAYVLYAGSASGVTSLSVNGGAAQTGPIALTIPPQQLRPRH